MSGEFLAGDIIKTRLGAVAGVTGLVGAPPNDKIHKFWLPQGSALPAIAYKQIAARRLQGTYNDPGFVIVTVQVISLAATMDGAHELDRQVRLALERFGSSQPAGIPFAGTTLYDIKPGSSADGYADEAELFFVTTDYAVHHLETTP
jgi:hypothetical protein